MSIDSQRAELERAFADRSDIEIVARYEESKSAKAPGRRVFGEMIERIEAGEAEGVLAWAPDRLARNSVDGGKVVYMLDCGVLKDIKFSTYTFENNPQGKFMLSIMFGQSKYYSDALSENVHRGLRAKLEKGWRPARPPIGYRTDPATRTCVPDPILFPLVRRMFGLVLSGQFTAKEVAILARDDWGFRMPRNRQSRGGPISVAAVYRLLGNPFYAGAFRWKGRLYSGNQEPAISWTEFTMVRERIARPGAAKPHKHAFAFTGLIRCGGCGLMITAERRIKPSGKTYVYYHCTKRALGPRCGEPAVRAEALEDQLLAFVRSLAIPTEVEAAVHAELEREGGEDTALAGARQESLEKAREEIAAEARELVQLRLRRLLSDEEFVREQERIERERLKIDQALANPAGGESRFELVRELVSFSTQAMDWFSRADPGTKREIVEILGSNPVLTSRKLSIQAAKPFVMVSELAASCKVCWFRNNVRTHARNCGFKRSLRKAVTCATRHPDETQKVLLSIRGLRNRFDNDLPMAA